jgi:hypothetical protein
MSPQSPLPTFTHPAFHGLFGTARADITPPVGIYARNWGAATHETAIGIHRPLYATVLTLRANASSEHFVIVVLDLGWWRTSEDEWALRGALLDALKLRVENVLVHVTHTHAGPAMCREDVDKPGGHLIAPYMDSVAAKVISATRTAIANEQPATLDWAYGRCGLACNRDLVDPANNARLVCGWNPANDSIADDTLLVGRAYTASGKLIASVVNYACHPTTLAWQNKLISPDFIGALNEVVENNTGGAPCLFLQGASGELSPREQYTGDVAVADRHGRTLGFAALAVLDGMSPVGTQLEYRGVVESGAPLALWQAMPAARRASSTQLRASRIAINIPLKDNLPTLAQINADLANATDGFQVERLRRRLRVRRTAGAGTTTTLFAWVWRVGEAVIVAQSNEAYSDLQTELRRRFAGQAVAVLNVTNAPQYAYLPPRHLYDKDLYQVWQTPFAAGCLEQTIEACAGAVAQM